MWRLDTLFDFIAHSKMIKRNSHNYNKKERKQNKRKRNNNQQFMSQRKKKTNDKNTHTKKLCRIRTWFYGAVLFILLDFLFAFCVLRRRRLFSRFPFCAFIRISLRYFFIDACVRVSVCWLVTVCQAPVLYSEHEHMHNWRYKQTVYLPENHQQQQMNDEWKIQNMNLIINATTQHRGK